MAGECGHGFQVHGEVGRSSVALLLAPQRTQLHAYPSQNLTTNNHYTAGNYSFYLLILLLGFIVDSLLPSLSHVSNLVLIYDSIVVFAPATAEPPQLFL